MKKNCIPNKLRPRIDARKKYKLSHAQVQMARELGMNPQKFGRLANHRQEKWKAPLPQFIEDSYFKSFGREQPENVKSIEESVEEKNRKKEAKRQQKLAQNNQKLFRYHRLPGT